MDLYLLSLHRFWQNVTLVTLVLVPVVSGYATGIPKDSPVHCRTLLPVHGGYKPSTTAPPFKLDVYRRKYKAGSTIRTELQLSLYYTGHGGGENYLTVSLIGDQDFKGFMIQVRPYGKLGLAGDMQYGHFRDYTKYAQRACLNATSRVLTSLTQTSKETKRSLDFQWVAPRQLQYPSCPDCLPNLNLQVWVTFVKDFATFWLYRHDAIIRYSGRKPPTVSPTTTSTPSTTTATTTTSSTTTPTTTTAPTTTTTTSTSTTPTTTTPTTTTPTTTTPTTTTPTTTTPTTPTTTTSTTTMPKTTIPKTTPTTATSTITIPTTTPKPTRYTTPTPTATTTLKTTTTLTSIITPTRLYTTTSPSLCGLVSIYDFEKHAAETMTSDIKTYVNSGATTQTTIKANTEVYKSYLFRPKPLVDVSKVETWVKTLYKTITWPLGIAPMAHHDWVVAKEEELSARAAQNKDVVLCLSAQIGDRMEQIVSELHGHVWQETHIYSDKATTLDFVRRIENTRKISAIIVSIGISDIPIHYAKCTPPESPQPAPRPCTNTPPPGLNPAMTWGDIKWLVTQTSLPVVLKGVMRGEDAVKAASIGVAGVIVSNQGGRILDGMGTTLDALSEVVTAAKGTRLDVYFDGGVRTGMDVVKAMILGAKLVFVGRPVMWGLHHSGQAGVEKVFDILQTEMVNTLKLIGAPSPRDLTPDMLIKGDSSTDIAMKRLGLK